MLTELYQAIDSPEEQGKSIVLPNASIKVLYLSERGELFCYSGICNRDKERVYFEGWPYYLCGKHTKDCKKYIKGLFRIKNGCILLSQFIDHEIFNDLNYKQLSNYIVRMPVANTCYFGIESRNEGDFEENEELSRACFGLTYSELDYIVKVYAERLGVRNQYIQYPRITRSMKNDNFCDITGVWIPAKFPYITFGDGDFSHVSLYGFYRHMGALLSMGIKSQLLVQKTFNTEIINRIKQISYYLPFEIIVTREYIVPNLYVE